MAVEGADDPVRYQDFTAAPNNDCPVVGSDTAITIQGNEVDSGFPLVLCLSMPESTGGTELVDFTSGPVQLIDISAREVGTDCTLALDRSGALDLSATFTGFCDSGLAASGFGLALSGTATGTLTCAGTPATVGLSFDGIAVAVSVE